MKRLIITLAAIALVFTSCNETKKTTKLVESTPKKEATQVATVTNDKGYALMKQNCFVCHMEKPDPSKRGQMIAPPMLRVQEHYKPSYPNKAEFVTAIKTWVSNPSEDKVMMPGAVRKFNLMPKITIADVDLQLIAETLYTIDFGNMPKMHKQGENKLALNNGQKWQLNDHSKKTITTIKKQLSTFKATDLVAYNQLGKTIFTHAKTILLDKSYDKETFSQLQKFFHNVEGNMHNLIAAKSIDTAKKEQDILTKKFNKFADFFE
jgi:hypothetical protein